MIRTGNPFLRTFFITAGWPRTKNPSEFEGTFEKGACNGREVPYGFLKLGRKIPENSSRFIRFLETKTTTSTTNCCTTICDIPGRPGPRIPKDWEGQMFLFLFLASLYPFLTGPRGSSGKTLLLKPKYRLKFSTCRLLNHHNSAFFQYPIYTPNCCWKIFLFLGRIPTLLGFRPKKHCR